jgi:hypothetical protein
MPHDKTPTESVIQLNYQKIKLDAEKIAELALATLLNDPSKEHLVVKK